MSTRGIPKDQILRKFDLTMRQTPPPSHQLRLGESQLHDEDQLIMRIFPPVLILLHDMLKSIYRSNTCRNNTIDLRKNCRPAYRPS